MVKSKRINIKVVSLIIFLLLILFPNNIYSMHKNEKLPSEVIVGGELLHIDMDTNKLMYYSQDDKQTQLKNYDLLCEIQGECVKKAFKNDSIKNIDKKKIMSIILSMNENEKVKLTILRNNEYKTVDLTKSELKNSYFTNKIPFSATLTYVNPNNKTFGAVGHDINIEGKNNILSNTGDIYFCEFLEVQKSNNNQIGNMHGQKICCLQGEINKINQFGAKGKLKEDKILKNNDIYEVGNAKDVKMGVATLLIQLPNEENKKSYEIEITKINKQTKPDTQGFEFEIIDKELIKNYGGIVQGMSGCPIIQNGKIIGALSHVILNNPTKGVGLYIQWMMEE
ncbi:hypothetical protein CHF27_000250 [Romboutsia maritimum]|uniref:Peptidase S55 domain-containing protein n=1 Tax=Romboutsia maritimum TaxID=2020948 RepID=A0A371IW17_9FIRM|nr:SpoIVB peptidase S55 domain-containing protein [Romboutsia maritimum]RDY24666.1 hypothetical protein CHF27_000250 [Romboutsia maritimum]